MASIVRAYVNEQRRGQKTRRVLLSSARVSFAISAIVVVGFTFLLFLAGYILQQQSVSRLQATLQPRQPVRRHGVYALGKAAGVSDSSPSASTLALPNPDGLSRFARPLFGQLREQMAWHEARSFEWVKVAYALLARDAEELCHSLIVLHDLHLSQSPAPRLLLFPRAWAQEAGTAGETYDPIKTNMMLLLKKASRQYRAILVPIGPLEHGADDYDRIMFLPVPGLVLNSRPLDSILAYYVAESLAGYPRSTNMHTSMMLFKPCKQTYRQFVQSGAAQQNSILPIESLLSEQDPDFKPHLYQILQDLRTAAKFNATAFAQTTAFLKLDDVEFPGPQYDIPYQKVVTMRPKDDDQSFIWEKMQSTYKDRRYRICGLDLKQWDDETPQQTRKSPQ